MSTITNKGRELYLELQKSLPPWAGSLVTPHEHQERCSLVCRAAKSYAGMMEEACNRQLTPMQEKHVARLEERIRAHVQAFGPGFEPVFSGDPRGATVKIKTPDGRYNDWGQTGICVPGS